MEMKEQRDSIEWYCVGHWLQSLYHDFIQENVAGEQNPCSSCEHFQECGSCPPVNFSVLSEKTKVQFGIQLRDK